MKPYLVCYWIGGTMCLLLFIHSLLAKHEISRSALVDLAFALIAAWRIYANWNK